MRSTSPIATIAASRAPRSRRASSSRLEGQPAGDCIDCRQCVTVCPTGIDIRNGAQLECIQCGLCIDACDNIMDKIGRPTRLIAYDTEVNLKRRHRRRAAGVQDRAHPHGALCRHHRRRRRHHALYAADAACLRHQRHPRPQSALRAHGGRRASATATPCASSTSSSRRAASRFRWTACPARVVEIVGLPLGSANVVEVGPDQSREFRVLVSNYEYSPPASLADHLPSATISNRACGRRRMTISAHRSDRNERQTRVAPRRAK